MSEAKTWGLRGKVRQFKLSSKVVFFTPIPENSDVKLQEEEAVTQDHTQDQPIEEEVDDQLLIRINKAIERAEFRERRRVLINRRDPDFNINSNTLFTQNN